MESDVTPSPWYRWFNAPPVPRLVGWAAILFALWLFQAFFVIGFFTFVLCILVRGFVTATQRRFLSGELSVRRELWLTLIAYLLLLAGFVAGSWLLAPRMIAQGRALLTRIMQIDLRAEWDQFLARTVGEYLLHRELGSRDSTAFREAFAKFQAEGQTGAGWYQHFGSLQASLVARFESEHSAPELRLLQADLLRKDQAEHRFESWFLAHQAPQILQENRAIYEARWHDQTLRRRGTVRPPVAADPQARERELREMVLSDVKNHPEELARQKSLWEASDVRQSWMRLRSSPEYQSAFARYYSERQKEQPKAFPFTWDEYRTLAEAYAQGEDAFRKALTTVLQEGTAAAMPSLAENDFILNQRLSLARTWWDTDPVAAAIRARVSDLLPLFLSDLEATASDYFRAALTLPVELITALFLAMYITFDTRNLRRRADSLGTTAIGNVYLALLPDLSLLVDLLGQFFRSRTLVAVFNSACSWLALWFLGIESELLLCIVVFITSYIPIVGIFLAGVPIVVVAILQPGGSLGLAGQVIIALTVIHLIEANVLSPLLLSRAVELHPLAIFLALIVGQYFFGLWGLILGVPVASFLRRLISSPNTQAPAPGIADAASTA